MVVIEKLNQHNINLINRLIENKSNYEIQDIINECLKKIITNKNDRFNILDLIYDGAQV